MNETVMNQMQNDLINENWEYIHIFTYILNHPIDYMETPVCIRIYIY